MGELNWSYIAVVGAVSVAGLAWQFFSNQTRATSWADLAEQLNLKHSKDQLEGVVKGVELVVKAELRSSGRGSSAFTVFQLILPHPVPAGLTIKAEGISKRVLRSTGDVQLGLPEVDHKLAVHADNAAEARLWAQGPQVGEALNHLLDMEEWEFSIQDGKLTFDVPKHVNDRERMEFLIGELVAVAKALSPRPQTSITSKKTKS